MTNSPAFASKPINYKVTV